MAHDATTIEGTRTANRQGAPADAQHLAWILVWSRETPERVGEVVLLPRSRGWGPVFVGRGQDAVTWSRQRPGEHIDTGPLSDAKLSRKQLSLTSRDDGRVEVVNLGRGQMIDPHGAHADRCVVAPGETCGVAGRALFLLSERPAHLPMSSAFPTRCWPTFGGADAFGIVGESPAVWHMRNTIGRLARASGHVLVVGRSGSGKELAARALHGLSERADGPWIAHNAAAIPEGLVSAELFGNIRGYPNPGTPARPGLVGAAHGGTLLLDEVGELSTAAQAALLRVLDAEGEYQRLGETRTRRSDVRVIGATNRDVDQLKRDFAARFTSRLVIPSLSERLEDVPLIARHLRQLSSLSHPLDMRRVQALVAHALPDQVRSLHAALSKGPAGPGENPATPRVEGSANVRLDAESLRATLEAHLGNRDATARALGLSSRFVLYRLLKKHGVEV